MNEPFLLIVSYKNQECSYEAKLLLQGFTYRIQVVIGATEVYFEPDETGGYRAVRMPGQNKEDLDKIDGVLLGLLAAKLEEIMA